MTQPSGVLSELARVEGGRVLAVLARSTGDVDLAEDAVQDAIVTALEVWPRTGVPADPSAWIYVAARRKALDILRREASRRDKELAARIVADPPEPSVVRDDQLRLIFTCTHPALDLDARVALALRTLCGLSVQEIARALLTTEAAMAKRLVRARRKIAVAGIPFAIPDESDLPERLAGVAGVIHLVYTAGHAASGDAVVRADLCEEAVRLARLLADLVPKEPTVGGLLALLLLSEARRPARVDPNGDLVALADQRRTDWDHRLIDEGLAWLIRSLDQSDGQADPYQLQAAISACHAVAPSYEATDWQEIARLYELLASVHANPIVDINASVAIAETRGPAAAIDLLHRVAPEHRSYTWHAAMGEMRLRLGDAGARADFVAAARLAPSETERRHLEGRARKLEGPESRR